MDHCEQCNYIATETGLLASTPAAILKSLGFFPWENQENQVSTLQMAIVGRLARVDETSAL